MFCRLHCLTSNKAHKHTHTHPLLMHSFTPLPSSPHCTKTISYCCHSARGQALMVVHYFYCSNVWSAICQPLSFREARVRATVCVSVPCVFAEIFNNFLMTPICWIIICCYCCVGSVVLRSNTHTAPIIHSSAK